MLCQVISITNCTGGNFQIIVQGMATTAPLSVNSQNWEVQNALYYTSQTIPYQTRQVNYFTVVKRTKGAGSVNFEVTMEVDSPGTVTLLTGINFDMTGNGLSHFLHVHSIYILIFYFI
jgi:hypothetical protein